MFLFPLTKLWPLFLSLCCTTHIKVFPCTILSGKTHHLSRPQGNGFAEVFPSFGFIRIWLRFAISPVTGCDSVQVSYCQQYHGKVCGWFLEAETGSRCAMQWAITVESLGNSLKLSFLFYFEIRDLDDWIQFVFELASGPKEAGKLKKNHQRGTPKILLSASLRRSGGLLQKASFSSRGSCTKSSQCPSVMSLESVGCVWRVQVWGCAVRRTRAHQSCAAHSLQLAARGYISR